MRGLLKAVSLCWLITTGVASAQGWQPRVFDNASWFTISASIGQTATIYCGGRSAGGVPLPQTDEPLMTPDYQLMLTLDLPGLATQENYPAPRNDVMLVKGTTGYMLPNLQIDELNGFGWLQLLDMGDPLFAAMIDGGPFEIRADGTPIGQLHAFRQLPLRLRKQIQLEQWRGRGPEQQRSARAATPRQSRLS